MALAPGTRIGAYEVVGPLGAGGMGEVYRATDLHLKRPVALKVLPEPLAGDADRVAPFQREAELLATLAHPAIAAIYGLEASTPTRALVLECVEGETLADRLARGPLPPSEAVPLARQIADALDYAHEQGVLHRDLKPANIKVTPDGQVKVLDFGLAKALDQDRETPGPQDLAASPTVTSPAMTRAGVILGTAAYMSPEQARGRRVDKRTDVWAFGCVLYEMLTGMPAFQGDGVVEVLGAVQHTEPDWSRLPTATPAGVRRLLERALTKDPARRLRDIGDASLILEPGSEPEAPRAGHAPLKLKAWQRPAPALVSAALAAALGAVAGWGLRPATAVDDTPATHLTIDPPPDAPISNRGGLDLAISPNGRLIAFLADGPNGRQMFLRDLSATDPMPLAGTEGADDPFFSWDGRSIVFESRSQSRLMRVAVDGGSPVAIAGAYAQTRGLMWAPDDIIVSAYNNGLWRTPVAGGTPQQILDAKVVVGITSRALPSGKGIVFDRVMPSREIMVLDSGTGEARVLLPGQNAWFVPSGHLVFTRDNSMMAVGFDDDTLTVTGEPVVLVEGLRVATAAASDFVVSDTGTIAYIAGGSTESDRAFQWLDRSGRTASIGARVAAMPRLSPDGRWLAFATRNGGLWSVDLARGTENRLATDVMATDLMAVGVAWTPDSRHLTFVRRLEDGYAIESVAPEGDGPATRLFVAETLPSIGSWSPDGSTLGLRVGVTDGRRDIAFLDTRTGTLSTPLETPWDESAPRFSPDGTLVAFVSEDSGRPQVYVRAYPTGPRLTVSVDGGLAPVWSKTGRTLYFAGPVAAGLSTLMASEIDTMAGGLRATVPTPVLPGTYELSNSGGNATYDVSPDGTRFIVLDTTAESVAANNRIHVILNWPALLRNRAK